MELTRVRRALLWSFIGFLSATALIAVSCLFGNQFGELQAKVLATTFTISAASICAMACAVFMEKRGLRAWGFAGMLLSAVAAAATVFGIWVESNSDVYWKTTGTLIVLATAFTHALLMQIPVLKPAHRWTQVAAAILVAVLSLEIIYVIVSSSFEHDTDTIFRLIAATSVFVVLLTLVIPICAKLGANRKANDERLVLEKISDDTFADSSGRKYRVTAIGNE
jgi:hypothetical protein